MRAQYIDKNTRSVIEDAVTFENRVVLSVAETTGLRIDDILSLEPRHLAQAIKHKGWTEVTEQKTGKRRKVRLTNKQMRSMSAIVGEHWIFPHKNNPKRHRARQTVYIGMKRAAKRFKIAPNGISPHSYRKIYAVNEYRKTGDIETVQRKLNHKNPAVTLLYVTSDRYKFKSPVKAIKKKTLD